MAMINPLSAKSFSEKPAGMMNGAYKTLGTYKSHSCYSLQNLPDDLKRPLDLFPADVVMRDHPHLARVDAVGQYAPRFQLGAELRRGQAGLGDVEDHDVGWRAFRVDLHAAQFSQAHG